ncbi:hypothetical protein, partial [Staphylococcus aureus]|uniref:hypothetical protein n=1 Tax=Staphylococcus aureus TaxID=1280 RepID=UPI0039BE8CF3
ANALGGGGVNAGDEAGVRAQVHAQAQRQRSTAEFWSSIFATPQGRAEMWAILSDLKTFEATGGVSANGGYDPVVSAYYNGRRDAGQTLFLSWMAFIRDGSLLMLAEHERHSIEIAKTVATVKPRRQRKKNPTA